MSPRPRYPTGPSQHIEITYTRKGTWRIEGPCGWWQDFGPGLDLAVAKSLAYYHRRRCQGGCRKAMVGHETYGLEVAS